MSIAVLDAAVVAHTAVGGDTVITQSFTVTSGAAVLVVLETVRLATALSTGVTWNGGVMTAKGDNAYGDMWCQGYVTTNPTSGTHSVVATWDASRRGVICIFTLSGVDTTTPTRTSAGASSLTTGAATTVAGDFCAAVGGQRLAAPTDPASFTNLGSDNADANVYGDFVYKVAAGASQSATFGGSIGDFEGSLLIPFIPASGGGRTLFLQSALDGLSGSGPKQFNPLQYHRHPMLSLAGYRREQARKHREFMAKVARRAA